MKNKVKKYEIRAREAAINGDVGILLLLLFNGGVRVDNDELKTLLEAADHRNRKLAFQRRTLMKINQDEISQLLSDLDNAKKHYEQMKQQASFARSQETSAVNKLNDAQTALDKLVKEFKKDCPRESNWGRES